MSDSTKAIQIIESYSVKKPALPYESALPAANRKRGLRFDPYPDPRTEKLGRKQRNKAYLRVMEFFGKSV